MDLKKDMALKSGFKGLLVILFLVLSVSMIPSQNAEAASKKSKALKAYSKLLSQSTIQWGTSNMNVSLSSCEFALVYLNNDSIPELLIRSDSVIHSTGQTLLYTYKSGKAKFVSKLHDVKYYKKTGILRDNDTNTGIQYWGYYKFSGSKLKMKIYKEKSYSYTKQKEVTSYYSGSTYSESASKKLTKAKFNSKLKSYTGGKKISSPKYYANSSANRNKYLK